MIGTNLVDVMVAVPAKFTLQAAGMNIFFISRAVREELADAVREELADAVREELADAMRVRHRDAFVFFHVKVELSKSVL